MLYSEINLSVPGGMVTIFFSFAEMEEPGDYLVVPISVS
jgi:hypothetical protein